MLFSCISFSSFDIAGIIAIVSIPALLIISLAALVMYSVRKAGEVPGIGHTVVGILALLVAMGYAFFAFTFSFFLLHFAITAVVGMMALARYKRGQEAASAGQ
jgi:uncharacterized membrane protein